MTVSYTHLVEDYMVYLLLDLVFAVVPVLALALDWVDVVIPSLICITAGVISLAWLLIFQLSLIHI